MSAELPPESGNPPPSGLPAAERRTINVVMAASEGVGGEPTIFTLREQPNGWWRIEERLGGPTGSITVWPVLHHSLDQVRSVLYARAHFSARASEQRMTNDQ